MTLQSTLTELNMLEENVNLLADRIAVEFRTVDAEMGELSALTTTTKSSLVSAINEVKTASATPSNIDGGNF